MNETTRNGIPVDDGRDEDLTPEDWAAADGAYERHIQRVLADPTAKAAHYALLNEINESQATLARLRQARQLTQATMADLLDMTQSEVSKLERRTDMLISTLRRFIEAAGGRLRLIVTYDDARPVEITVLRADAPPVAEDCADERTAAVVG